MTTATIFAYKGHVAAVIDMKNGKFINNPNDGQQLGCVIRCDEVAITPEALAIIKVAERDPGSFAPLMITRHEGPGLQHGPGSIGLQGFGKFYLGNRFRIGRTCDMAMLDLCPVDEYYEIDPDYIDFINGMEV